MSDDDELLEAERQEAAEDARIYDETTTWTDTDRTCPDDGGVIQTSAWWDDHPANGGAWIGTRYQCKNDDCDWWDEV